MKLANSFNLARRLSAVNEPDLLQEDYVMYTEDECERIVQALQGQLSRIPSECRTFVGTIPRRPIQRKYSEVTPRRDRSRDASDMG